MKWEVWIGKWEGVNWEVGGGELGSWRCEMLSETSELGSGGGDLSSWRGEMLSETSELGNWRGELESGRWELGSRTG